MRLALKVVRQNDRDFVDAILLYAVPTNTHSYISQQSPTNFVHMKVVTLAANALGCLEQVTEERKQNPGKYMNLEWIFFSYVYFAE